MPITATYLDDLSRVRLDINRVIDVGGTFEAGLGGWTVYNATAVHSNARAHSGSYSMEITPDGVAERCFAKPAGIPVSEGSAVTVTAWMWFTVAVTNAASLSVTWLDSSGAYLRTSEALTSAPAASWARLSNTFTAPAGAAFAEIVPTLIGTPPSSLVWYVDDAIIHPGTSDAAVTVERSTDGVRWSMTRGGASVNVIDGAGVHHDYEFTEGVENLYRATYPDGVQEVTFITPRLTCVWLKNISRPNMNQKVIVTDVGTISRASRAGIFDVIGRRDPLAITDLHTSRETTVQLMTTTTGDAVNIDAILRSGDVFFLHAPRDTAVPSFYSIVGNYTVSRGRSVRSPRRFFELPLTEVAAPDAVVTIGTVTWDDILTAYPTWTDLLAAHATWDDVMQIVAEQEVLTP